MYWARDVKADIITRLTDSTNGISALLTTINTERTETTAAPYKVDAAEDTGQYPAVFVDLGDSTIDPAIGSTYKTFYEEFELEITALLKDSNVTKLKNDCENYIEAIIRSLQGYNKQSDESNYICQAREVLRADIDTDRDMTLRAVTVVFTVFNNKLY